MEVLPKILSSTDVEKQLGMKLTCPLCRVQSTSDSTDIGWVSMPELQRGPKWICLGSWIDVSSIARADDPSRHPYYDDLVRLAGLAGTSPAELTQALLQRQLSVLQSNPKTLGDPELRALQSRIEGLLEHVHQ